METVLILIKTSVNISLAEYMGESKKTSKTKE